MMGSRLERSLLLLNPLVVAVVLLSSAPASYASVEITSAAEQQAAVVRRGPCSGPSRWKLDVRTIADGRLRVRFTVRGGKAGQKWHVFLDHNGRRIFAGSRISQENGLFVVTRRVPDRPRADRFTAGANNTVTGEICKGRARY
jgi:hypothetical protein